MARTGHGLAETGHSPQLARGLAPAHDARAVMALENVWPKGHDGGGMHTLIEMNRDRIAELCRRHRVRRLEVFGSAARGVDFDPASSDADFLVSFDRVADGSTLDEDIALTAALEALLGRRVDLVRPELIANPFILASVNRTREVVFAA